MGNRHFPNSFNMFEINHDHTRNHQSEQSYHQLGGRVASENGSFVSPPNNMSRGGLQTDPRWNLEDRENDYSYSSCRRELPNYPPAFPFNSYYPYSRTPAAGNLYMHPENNAGHMHSDYFNRQTVHDVEDGTGRGSLKRKYPAGPAFSGQFERGSSSRSFVVGSSSGSSQNRWEKSTSDCRGFSIGPSGLPQRRGCDLSIAGEDSLRNVRSRSHYAEPNSMRTHLSRYPSQIYHSTNFPANPSAAVNFATRNADLTGQQWDRGTFPVGAHERAPIAVINSSSHSINRFVVEGTAANADGGRHGAVPTGHPVSSSLYFNGTSAQVARERHTVHSRRAMSTYRSGPGYSHLRHESFTSEGLHAHPESSRYSRPFSAGGLHDTYRNGWSRLDIERFRSVSGVVDAHDSRMDTQASMMVDHPSFYSESRSSFDQYRDMRLDVDSMSYEELLALGETIGNVSTGLSEDSVTECLTEKLYCSGDQSREEGPCTICLEEYKNGDGIGTLNSCRHVYHVDCIRKWLSVKNVCPICKAAALAESSN